MSGIPMKYRQDPGARIWPRLVQAGDCLEWTGSRNEHGYGGLRIDGQLVKAHRFAFELVYGPIPDGMDVCHRCDNPPCCNPVHLFLGTARDNGQDMVRKRRHGSWAHPESRPRGEAHHAAKLTWDVVRAIRSRADESRSALAREFGVSRRAIRCVIDGVTWQ